MPKYCFLLSAGILFSNLAVGQTSAPGLPAPSTFPPSSSASPSQVTAQPAVTPVAPSAAVVVPPHYRVVSGDVLDIVVFGAPELSQHAPVNPQGDVYLPLINSVHVAGLTLEETQSSIEKSLRQGGFLNAPHVNVGVASRAGAVTVMGEVVHPGAYPLDGSGKLLDALRSAGGPSSAAGRTIFVSHEDGTRQSITLPRETTDTMPENIPLSRGDMVEVSKAGVVYIVGEVLAPAGIVMDQKVDYTVAKAYAIAHGATKNAKLSKARIVRNGPGGVLQDIPVPLDKILVSKAPDVPLQPEDILFIPSNTAKIAANRAGEIAISLASGVVLIGAQRF